MQFQLSGCRWKRRLLPRSIPRLVVMAIVAFVLIVGLRCQPRAIAQAPLLSFPLSQPSDITELSHLTFNTLVFGEAGRLDVQDLVSVLDYDPSRQWRPGETLADVMQLGDFGGHFPYSVQSIVDVTGADLSRYRLSDLGLLADQSIADVVEAIPDLRSMLIDQVPLVARQSGRRKGTKAVL